MHAEYQAHYQSHNVLAQPWKAEKRLFEGPDAASKSHHDTACY